MIKRQKIAKRTTTFTESLIREMTRVNNTYNAVNLAQGFPDFPPNPKLVELVKQALDNNHHQYAPLAGLGSLRETLAEKLNNSYQLKYSAEHEITITAGATQAIFTAISAFIQPNDEVIVFKPAYDCYEPAIELYGGKPVLVEMRAPEYKIDWQEVSAKITSKTN